jgi:threonine dehydrogenase-like Zn-dependent dehydrogenase
MRRVVVYPDRIAVEAAAIPAPGPNEALVRTLVAGVCGSDLHAARGSHPFVPLPYRPGHEVVGVIEAAGSAAQVALGQRVIVEPDLRTREPVREPAVLRLRLRSGRHG